MNFIAKIAEERIKKALEEGLFDGLSGAGKPLLLEDETWIPEDLRPAYRVLKNAGYIPPELELRKEVVNLRDLIETLDDEKEKMRRLRELNFRIMKLEMIQGRPSGLSMFPEYIQKLFEKKERV